ncbi:MAG: hypothetical protein Q8O67_05855 [Deltaproteobacteria bacterium]|nr:hypothetical protein [Deltaproteobacteria bacterium]
MHRVVVVLGLLVGTVGCGDLSQEDLLFRAAVPPKQAVAVTPPGADGSVDDDGANTQSQGLEVQCAEGDLRCEAQKIAGGFNGLTFTLLDVVDKVAGLPPSLREPGRRVWGPIFDDAKNQSFRFEMVREDDEVTFSFCLFMAPGRVGPARGGRALTCSDDDDGDLIKVFSGAFEPSGIDGEAARRGRGTMRFEADKVSRFDGSERFARALDFAFDNTEGTEIQIDVEGATVGELERDASYEFTRVADGGGTFLFDVFANLVSEGLIPELRLEHISLSAEWNADQAGRAQGVVDGGDIAPGTELSTTQCWGVAPGFELVFFDGVDDAVAPIGDEANCAFQD